MSERVVHVVNGTTTEQLLAETELPGEFVVWADALDVGPVGADLPAGFRARRASFWSELLTKPLAATEAELARADAAFDAALVDASEVVFWYEHDLFDQLALVCLLARVANSKRREGLTLVSIDRHPDVPDFRGFGMLAPHQLAGLWPRRVPIARDALDEAAATWAAFTASDPRALLFVGKRSKALSFLAGALERFIEDFPDTTSGLSRTQRQLLAAVGRGNVEAAALQKELAQSDPRYPITDVGLRACARELRTLGLLATNTFALTDPGRAALAGNFDVVREVGIDRWHGGVHLTGRGPMWRYDGAERRPVRT